MVGRGRAVATPVRPIEVRMRLDLDHAIGTRAEEISSGSVSDCGT